MPRKENIPTDIKEIVMEDVIKGNVSSCNLIYYVLDKVVEYKNKKQTYELLVKLVSCSKVKQMGIGDYRELDFSKEAQQLVVRVGCKDEYTDPDLYSLRLYIAWGIFLKKKKIICDYTIVYKNDSVGLMVSYKDNQNQYRKIELGTDGIPIKKINQFGYDRQIYKSLGSFLIWPRSNQEESMTINQKKGCVLKDDWKLLLAKIEEFYEKGDRSFFTRQVDIEWMEYIGNWNKEKTKIENFYSCYELYEIDNFIDKNGIPECIFIKNRNENMWNIIQGINK